jgi:hypothetical protein
MSYMSGTLVKSNLMREIEIEKERWKVREIELERVGELERERMREIDSIKAALSKNMKRLVAMSGETLETNLCVLTE